MYAFALIQPHGQTNETNMKKTYQQKQTSPQINKEKFNNNRIILKQIPRGRLMQLQHVNTTKRQGLESL